MKLSIEQKSWQAVLPAMIIPFIGALFYFVILGPHPAAKIVYTGIKGFTLFWPLIACYGLLGYPLKRPIFKLQIRDLFRGTGAGLLVLGIMIVSMQTEIGEMIRGGTLAIKNKTADLGILHCYWRFGIFLAVFHSLLEEYYWRFCLWKTQNPSLREDGPCAGGPRFQRPSFRGHPAIFFDASRDSGRLRSFCCRNSFQ